MSDICRDCGACCLKMGVPPLDEYLDAEQQLQLDIDNPEYKALPDELKREIDAAWEKGTASFVCKPCIWLDQETRKCKHYEYRPIVCRHFGPGDWMCDEDREAIGLAPLRLELVTAKPGRRR